MYRLLVKFSFLFCLLSFQVFSQICEVSVSNFFEIPLKESEVGHIKSVLQNLGYTIKEEEHLYEFDFLFSVINSNFCQITGGIVNTKTSQLVVSKTVRIPVSPEDANDEEACEKRAYVYHLPQLMPSCL